MKIPAKVDYAFACICTDHKFSLKDVYILYSQIQRHMSVPIKLYCLTDRKSARSRDGLVFIKLKKTLPGWWNKVFLFDQNVTPCRFLVYVDLDTVVLKPIDHLLSWIGKAALVYAQDAKDPLSSSLMIIDRHDILAHDIVRKFNLKRCLATCKNDQYYFSPFVLNKKYKTLGLPCCEHYSYKYLIDYKTWRQESTNPQYRPLPISQITTLNLHGLPKPIDVVKNCKVWPYSGLIKSKWRI